MRHDVDSVRSRYPRLHAAIMRCGVFSATEASACLRDLASGHRYSGEAVNHFGGTREVVRYAIHWRKFLRSRGVKV